LIVKGGFNKIDIQPSSFQCEYHYIPEYTTYVVIFRAIGSTDDRNFIKNFQAAFKKIVIFFLAAFVGPLILELE
jgi:hypothetical protein